MNSTLPCLPIHLQNALKPLLQAFEQASVNEIWLVGGTVRDLLLGQTEIPDLDLAVPLNPVALAKKYARAHHAGFVVLDDDRHVARLVEIHNGQMLTIDLVRFKVEGIYEDLRLRDFTINAIAARLNSETLNQPLHLLDPLDGTRHLKERTLHACAKGAFIDDPLRLLRAFRFAALLELRFSPALLELLRRDAALLSGVSMERIRDEFFKIISVKSSIHWIRLLDELGLLRQILPELDATKGVTQNDWHHLDVFDHSLATLERFEELLGQDWPFSGSQDVRKFLQEPISGTRTYQDSYKLVCLLHDLAKLECRREVDGKVIFHGHEMAGVEKAEAIGERLKLANSERELLGRAIKNHMRPGVMAQQGVNDRRLFKYYSKTGREGAAIALFSLADRLAAHGGNQETDFQEFQKTIFAIIVDFYRQMEFKKCSPLLSGDDLIKEFQLKPGPRFKEILGAVSEGQNLKTIKTREEALEFVRQLLCENT